MKTTTFGRFSPTPWLPKDGAQHNSRIFSNHPKTLISSTKSNAQDYSHAQLKAMSQWGYDPTLSATTFRNHIATAAQYKVERALRTKSSLDEAFFYTSQSCISEAFKISEFSSAREVLTLDVNSMFPWILKTAPFPDPSRLQLNTAKDILEKVMSGEIDNGIALCKVIYKSQWLEKLNEFAPIFFGASFGTSPITQASNEQFVVWLHACEIRALWPYCTIECALAIHSPKSIKHPLYSWVDKGYALKASAEPQEREVAKEALTTLHSCTITRKMTKTSWLDEEEVKTIFANTFMSEPFERQSYAQTIDQDDRGRSRLRIYDVHNPKNVYCLSSTVFAQARARMFELIMHTSAIEGVRVCYSNIDSMHISLPQGQADRVLAGISAFQRIGNQLGELKVECQSKHGVWLDAGVYWLLDEDMQVKKFASIDAEQSNPFKTHATYTYTCPLTHTPKEGVMPLFKSLSFYKRLDKSGNWTRPSSDELLRGADHLANQRTLELNKIIKVFAKIRKMRRTD